MSKEKPTGWDYAIILTVFAITGTTTAVLGKPILNFIGVERGWSVSYVFTYFVVMTAIYPFLLLGFAFLFGKYRYFLEKQKMMGQKIKNLFGKAKT